MKYNRSGHRKTSVKNRSRSSPRRGGKDPKRKDRDAIFTFAHARGIALKRSTRSMNGLIRLAKRHPEKTWVLFQRWYHRSTRGDMPSWIIERFDVNEAHIHLWDYATEAIDDYIRRYCATNKLDYSEEFIKDPLHTRHLCISKGGKTILRIHNTSCSTASDPYICAHLLADDVAARTLLRLFRISIYPKHMAFYRKIYREERFDPSKWPDYRSGKARS